MNCYISENIKDIVEKIELATKKSNRNKDDVLLLAVSKTVEVNKIKVAVENGLTQLGENKVQELVDKFDELKNVKWHFIGHLQTNKVKYIIDKVELIHSVDSLKLVEEINKQAMKKDLICNILLQVNIANDDAKFGLAEKDVFDFISNVKTFKNIRVRGLMTVPPFVENKEDNRIYFRKMRTLFVDINEKKIDNINMDILSMGMSNDYEVAIEEGATIVRIGTDIFGERNYV